MQKSRKNAHLNFTIGTNEFCDYIYDAIVEHRKTYYALKYVNYDLHTPSTINFTIPESAMEAWQDDYADMRRFFIYGESLEFGALIQKMKELQERVRIM